MALARYVGSARLFFTPWDGVRSTVSSILFGSPYKANRDWYGFDSDHLVW